MTHVDDAAAGIIAALDRGRRRGVRIAGERIPSRRRCAVAARDGGHKPPRLTRPDGSCARSRRSTIGSVASGLPGGPARDRRGRGRRTFWRSQRQGRSELGFAPRGASRRGCVDTYRRTLLTMARDLPMFDHRTMAPRPCAPGPVDRDGRWSRRLTPADGATPPGAIRTGSGPGCRPARTTTSSRA